MSIEPDQSQATGRGSIPVDSFGNRLMLARAHAGHLSIREAADLCDIGRGAWTNWEKGARPADIIEVAAVVADKLGVDRDWLLFGGNLGQAEARQLRRGRPGPEAIPRYSQVADPVAIHTPHPRDNRPPGHPTPVALAGGGRTSYVSRGPRGRRA